jgi:hypothetical protein
MWEINGGRECAQVGAVKRGPTILVPSDGLVEGRRVHVGGSGY